MLPVPFVEFLSLKAVHFGIMTPNESPGFDMEALTLTLLGD
jgi:hypothetical protein